MPLPSQGAKKERLPVGISELQPFDAKTRLVLRHLAVAFLSRVRHLKETAANGSTLRGFPESPCQVLQDHGHCLDAAASLKRD